jgi:hypothetical protein
MEEVLTATSLFSVSEHLIFQLLEEVIIGHPRTSFCSIISICDFELLAGNWPEIL